MPIFCQIETKLGGIFGLNHVLMVVSVGRILQKYEANDLKMIKKL